MGKLLRGFIGVCDRISRACGIMAGIMMLAGLALILGEIVVRTLFSKTLYITEEYTGYLMVALTFLGLSYTLKERGHIRMAFLPSVLKGRPRLVVDLYAFAVGLFFCVLVTASTAAFFWDSVVAGSRSMQLSGTYLAVPQFFLPLGMSLMGLQFLAEFCRAALKLAAGETDDQDFEPTSLGR